MAPQTPAVRPPGNPVGPSDASVKSLNKLRIPVAGSIFTTLPKPADATISPGKGSKTGGVRLNLGARPPFVMPGALAAEPAGVDWPEASTTFRLAANSD